MAWIKVTFFEKAGGILRRECNALIKRALKLLNVVSIITLNLYIIRDLMSFYKKIMFVESLLSPKRQEISATVSIYG